eukprot:s28_g7.t1
MIPDIGTLETIGFDCQAKAAFWRQIELEGELPHQMLFTLFVMLPKTETIERPIGLMSTLLKLGIKSRWHLVGAWLEDFREHLWWDNALPSRSTHDAALRRGFAYEAAKTDGVHRMSLNCAKAALLEALRSQGPEAVNAFQAALEEGTQAVQSVKLCFVGHARPLSKRAEGALWFGGRAVLCFGALID